MVKRKIDREAQILTLSTKGHNYNEIARLIDLNSGTVWRVLNRERCNRNTAESSERYRKRGYVALCDLSRRGHGPATS